MFVRFIPVVTYTSSLLNGISLYGYSKLLFYFIIDEHLGSFQFRDITNNDTIKIMVHAL